MSNYLFVSAFEIEINNHLKILNNWVEDLEKILNFCNNSTMEHMGKQIIFLVQQIEIQIKEIKKNLLMSNVIKIQEDKQEENELFEFFERSTKDFYKKIQRI